MNSRSAARSGSTVRVPVNAGVGRSSARHSTGVRRVRGLGDGEQRPARLLRVDGAQPLLVGARLGVEVAALFGIEQPGDDADDARGVEDVHGRLRVGGRDPHRGVLLRRRRAADQQRQLEPAPLHLLRHVHHLVERRRDEPGEPDEVAVLVHRGVEDLVGVDHDAEVDHLVVVAAEDDPDDVLADVVDVALDRREHELALRARLALDALGVHVGLEVGDGALHGARALHDLREEHLPGAEQVADDLHPAHERALDHVERPLRGLPRLLRVLLDEVHHPVDEGVRQPLLHVRLAPGEVDLALRRLAVHRRRELDHALGRVGPAVEDDVLDALEQVGRDVAVDRELARVHDPHVEPGADRVVEERRVDRLAHGLVAAKREGQVGDPAGDLRAGAALLDQRDRVDERLGELVVLLHPGGDGEHVRVEDQILRRTPSATSRS